MAPALVLLSLLLSSESADFAREPTAWRERNGASLYPILSLQPDFKPKCRSIESLTYTHALDEYAKSLTQGLRTHFAPQVYRVEKCVLEKGASLARIMDDEKEVYVYQLNYPDVASIKRIFTSAFRWKPETQQRFEFLIDSLVQQSKPNATVHTDRCTLILYRERQFIWINAEPGMGDTRLEDCVSNVNPEARANSDGTPNLARRAPEMEAVNTTSEKSALETVEDTQYAQLLWGAVATETAYAFQQRTGGVWHVRRLKVELNQIAEFLCATRRRLLRTLSARDLNLATKAICDDVPEEYTEQAGYFTTITPKQCMRAATRCR